MQHWHCDICGSQYKAKFGALTGGLGPVFVLPRETFTPSRPRHLVLGAAQTSQHQKELFETVPEAVPLDCDAFLKPTKHDAVCKFDEVPFRKLQRLE